MPATDGRLNRPVGFAEAMGGTPDGPLELNRMESATCAHCGCEPRLFHHLSPKGRDVTIWIPQDHTCRPGKHEKAHAHDEMR